MCGWRNALLCACNKGEADGHVIMTRASERHIVYLGGLQNGEVKRQAADGQSGDKTGQSAMPCGGLLSGSVFCGFDSIGACFAPIPDACKPSGRSLQADDQRVLPIACESSVDSKRSQGAGTACQRPVLRRSIRNCMHFCNSSRWPFASRKLNPASVLLDKA